MSDLATTLKHYYFCPEPENQREIETKAFMT